jgi:hypothetical protein
MQGVNTSWHVQYPVAEERDAPLDKDYNWYHANALIAIEEGEPSNGVKGLFAFHKHPHASLITATTDYMHAFYNVIHDLIR